MSGQVGLWAKAVVGSVGSAAAAALTALQDGQIDLFEWIAILIAFLVTLGGVKIIQNSTSGVFYFAKAGFAALVAALGALGVAISDGWPPTSTEWVVILIALLNALPVSIASDTVAESDQIVRDRGLPPPQPAPDE